MKPIIYKTILVLGICLITASCGRDFLKEEPITQFSTESAYSSAEGLEGAVMSLYNFPRLMIGNQETGTWLHIGTDLSRGTIRTRDKGLAFYDNRITTFSLHAKMMWDFCYKNLYNANVIIDGAEKVEIDGDRKNRVLGEARFSRAYTHFHLVRRFGNVYLAAGLSDEVIDEPRPASEDEVYNHIIADLEFAMNNLEWEYGEPGRFTKGLAMHLLAKVALVRQDWDKAASLSQSIINDGPYSLLADHNDLWDPTDKDQNHSETIYALQYEPGLGEQGHQLMLYFTSRYDRVVGVKRSYQQGARPWGRTQVSDHLAFTIFQEGDLRLKSLKRYWFFDDEANLPPGKNLGDTVRVEDSPLEEYLYAAPKKYWDWVTRNSQNESRGFKDLIIYRLGETYLIAAEALMMQGKTGDALTYINTIRQRAEIGDLGALTIDDILGERARELYFEGFGHRWYDLKRTGKLLEYVQAYNPEGGPNIQQFHANMPIPQDFIDLTGYPQNSGY